MDTLSGPYIINLEHRIDRWKQVSEQFNRLNIKPVRIDAVYNKKDGATGCLESHIKALSLIKPNTKAIWICEDDCQFIVDKTTLEKTITSFLNTENNVKVLCLGYNSRQSCDFDKVFDRTTDNQTCTCYIVKTDFVETLRNLWTSVLAHRKNKTEDPLKSKYNSLNIHKSEYECTDQCWKLLQQDYVFLIPKVRCAIQTPSYSDIEKEEVDYGV
jgi:hypothetical protein